MGKAFKCDECGQLLEGEPVYYVSSLGLDVCLSKSFSSTTEVPDLCIKCFPIYIQKICKDPNKVVR